MAEAQDTKSIIWKILFFTVLICLAFVYLFSTFKGLTSKYGMDQAQIAREVARGNNLTTKFIRPLTIHQLQNEKKEVDLTRFYDTTHAPLNVLIYAGVLKAFGGDDFDRYKMNSNQDVYFLDRVIAGTCVLFFIIAVFINYLLVTKIFDAKIGSIVAILMVASESCWHYATSGLPQMLMLCIFSAACYMIWKAIDSQEHDRSPVVPVILCGFLFGLLALAHWLTLWIFIGFLIFAVFYFRPRGVVAVFLTITILLFIAAPLAFNANHSDGVMGTAFYYVQGKMGIQQDIMFRGVETPTMDVRNILVNTLRTTFLQTSEIHRHIGGFVLATAFFLSLMHPFKRSSIASFRWCIVIMWLFAALGMAIYGLSANDPIDPNQLHLLFMPMMSAFALALVSILWARIPMSQQAGFASLLPFTIIVIVAAGPMFFNLYKAIDSNQIKIVQGYYPNNTNIELYKQTTRIDPKTGETVSQIIYSDQPWAVAWYADTIAVWTPYKKEYTDIIENLATQNSTPITGWHISNFGRTTYYADYSPLIAGKGLAVKKFPHGYNLVGTIDRTKYQLFFSKLKPVEE